jgi:uncharacterized protein YbaR (Trm112 family)
MQVPKLPLLVCCDATHLPFQDNTFSFVFAYRSLHHFENPTPVAAECWRVLGRGGRFFLNDEPLTSPLRDWLRGGRVLSNPPNLMQNLGIRLGLQKVFWDDGAYERSVGITEARFNLSLWRKALAPFDRHEAIVNRKLKIKSNLYTPRLAAWLSGVIGGNIWVLCTKNSGEAPGGDFYNRLMCLDCNNPLRQNLTQETWTHQLLGDESLTCPACGRAYPVVDGVIRMLPKALEEVIFRNW